MCTAQLHMYNYNSHLDYDGVLVPRIWSKIHCVNKQPDLPTYHWA